MEHRWGERGRLADLSVSGALVNADIEARMLSRIKVAIVLPLWPMYDLPVLEAYVARKHKRAVGIEWCEFAPDSVRELLRAVVTRPHARIHRHTRRHIADHFSLVGAVAETRRLTAP